MNSNTFGFYKLYFYDKGFFNEIVIDDKFPVNYIDDKNKMVPVFIKSNSESIGPLLIEKAWSK